RPSMPLRLGGITGLGCGGGRDALLRTVLVTTPVAIGTRTAVVREAGRAPNLNRLGRGRLRRCFGRSGDISAGSDNGIGCDSIGRDSGGGTIFVRGSQPVFRGTPHTPG